MNCVTDHIELELLNDFNRDKVLNIQKDSMDEEFVYDISYTLKLAKFIADNNMRGHCYAIKYSNNYIGIVLVCEIIKDEVDLSKIPKNDYFKIIGFTIDKNYRGKGIGTKALELALKDIIKEYGNVPFLLECGKDNIQAMKVYEKLGFNNTNILNDEDEYFLIKP